MKCIRVGLVDDHRMFREALRIALADAADLQIVGEAADGAAALAMVETARPDVLVLDIALPDVSGVVLTGQLRVRFPELAIVALSGYADREFVAGMVAAGAAGYVVKSAGASELVAAIRAAVVGGNYFSPDALTAMMVRSPASPPRARPLLTERETVVLRHLASGLRTPAIARLLGIAPATVEVHRRNIKDKLGLRSVAELARYAVREGLIDQ